MSDSQPPPTTAPADGNSGNRNRRPRTHRPRNNQPILMNAEVAIGVTESDQINVDKKKSSAGAKQKKALAREDRQPLVANSTGETQAPSNSSDNAINAEAKAISQRIRGPKKPKSNPSPTSEVARSDQDGTNDTSAPKQAQSTQNTKKSEKKPNPSGFPPQRRESGKKQSAKKGANQSSLDHAGSSNGTICTICSREDTRYWSIGSCNHSICSLCSLRLRSKSKDRQCPICKLQLDVVIVFCSDDFDVSAQTFQAFPMVTSQGNVLELLDTPHPDVQVDMEDQIVYYKCASHYKEMDIKRSLHCPLPQCTLRCASVPQLCQHVSAQHQGQVMCKLCVDHRPLFCSEHQLFSKKELKEHMKGTLVLDSKTLNAAHAYTAGHPLCQFCQENVFDKHALYLHMQRKHLTCHLCDASMMFRYYADLASLRQHHQQDHYVCSMCHHNEEMRHSDICYAYRNFQEFSVHMKDMHGVRDFAKYVLGGHSVHRANHASNRGSVQQGGLQALSHHFFDLDLGNANPAPVQQARQRSQQLTQQPASVSDDILQLIPANMRIAGRVTGTGTFSSEDRDLLALQEAVDLALATRGPSNSNNGRSSYSYAGRLNANAVRSNMEFPSLPPSQDAAPKATKTSAINGEEGNSPHPMSLVGKMTAAKKDSNEGSKLMKEAEEEKRMTRHLQLASAFGVSPSSANEAQKDVSILTSDDLGVSANSAAYKKHVSAALTGLTITPTIALLHTLYPFELLAWAKKNRTELIKIERRIVTFFESSKDSSLHLKPMPHVDRQMLHCLAKFYHCQSVEYDYEPKRYVSLIKTVDSRMPSMTLSNAITYNSFISPTNNVYALGRSHLVTRGPVIYIVLNEGLLLHWGRPFERNKQSSPSMGIVLLPFQSKHVIFGEVVMQLRALCREYDMFLEDFVDHVAWAGPNAIALECMMRYYDNGEVDSELALYHAIQLAKFLVHISSLVNNIATANMVQGEAADFLRFYRVMTDFVMPDEKAGNASSQAQVDADGFVVVSGSKGSSKPLPGIDIDDEVTFSRKKEEESVDDHREDHWTLPEESAKLPVSNTVPGLYQPPRPPTTTTTLKSHDGKVGDDWENVAAVDEWEEFLAERSAKLTASSVEPYKPKIPAPKAALVVAPAAAAPDTWDDEPVTPSNHVEEEMKPIRADEDNWRKGLKVADAEDTEHVEAEVKKDESTTYKPIKKPTVPAPKVVNRFSLLNDDDSDQSHSDEEEEA